MRSSSGAAASLGLAVVLLLVGAPLSGQPAERGPATGPVLSLSGSVLTPLSRLTDSDVSFDTEVSASAAISGGLTWWRSDHLGATIRATWAPAKLGIRGVPLGVAVPDDLGDADYLAGTVEANYRFLPGGAAEALEPYVGLGAGLRHLALDPVAAPEARGATDLVATAAGGTRVRVWERTSLRVELRHLLSEFDATETGRGEWQHDVLVSVGVSYRP